VRVNLTLSYQPARFFAGLTNVILTRKSNVHFRDFRNLSSDIYCDRVIYPYMASKV